MKEREGVRERLAEVARGFYQSKLAVAAPSVEVILEENLVLVRVQGFVTAADQRMMASAENRGILENYYTRLTEMIHPLLDQVLCRDLGRSPVGRRTMVDLERSECLYLLTLAGKPLPESSRTLEGWAGDRRQVESGAIERGLESP